MKIVKFRIVSLARWIVVCPLLFSDKPKYILPAVIK